MSEQEAIDAFEAAFGHPFEDRALLVDALTHSSFANEKPHLARTDNDRLEFLGDAVLQWAVSSLISERFPEATAGEMTRRRADLVCETGLAEVATALGLGEALRLGKGEERSGGRDKPRLLSSALEACVAAVYLDAGTRAVTALCERVFEDRLHGVAPGERDFKTRLQEALQQQGRRPPRYRLAETQGPDHDREFRVIVLVEDTAIADGEGRSKLEAEQAAAEKALTELEARAEADAAGEPEAASE